MRLIHTHMIIQMAENGLIFTPVIPDTTQTIQHRFVCTHCKATLTTSIEVCSSAKLRPRNIPTIEAIRKAHQSHPLATRWSSSSLSSSSSSSSKKVKEESATANGSGGCGGFVLAYKCYYAYGGYPSSSSSSNVDHIISVPVENVPHMKTKKAGWDAVNIDDFL
jgi:hypothetical protein